MAIYSIEEIHKLVKADAWELATTTCKRDVRNLGLTRQQVTEMLLALDANNHRLEFGSVASDFGEIYADDYLLWYDEETKARCSKYNGACFYIKLGVHTDDEGSCCLIVSFHLDSRP